MAWNQQTESTLNGWFGLQEKMLKGWWDVLAQPQGNDRPAMSAYPFWEMWMNQGLQQWQTFYQENFATIAQGVTAEVSKNAMAQFLTGQDQAQKLMRMVTEAWQTMLTNAASPAEWQSALIAYTDQLRQQMNMALDNVKLTENSAELWRLYYGEAQKVAQPWLSAWWQSPVFLSKLNGTDHAAATNDFMQLFHAAFEQTIGPALMSPSIGLTREFNEKVSKAFDLWLENQQAQTTYQLLVGEAWLDAFQAFMRKLMDMAQKGETITDQRHFMRIWVEVADEIFIELFHSESYAAAQSAYVNSNMTLRRQQRVLLEVWLREHDMPTRSDLDEAHHQIYELRKEVRALKKSMTARAVEIVPAVASAKAKAPAKPSSKSRASAAKTKTPPTVDEPAAPQSTGETATSDAQPQEGAA